MDKSNPYFILSGFLSLSLFTLFLALFFLMMLGNPSVDNFALKKDNYISISLNEVTIPIKRKTTEPVMQQVEAQIIEEVQVKEIDIGDLFSEVWTKDIKIEKKKEKLVDNKRLELIKKSEKVAQKKVKENIDYDLGEELDKENKNNSTANEVNEYLARIQAIVYKYFLPPVNSQGYTVKAVIELSLYGKVLDFRVLTYSENKALNQECDKIKDRLVGVLFPSNPSGISSTTIVNITSDK